MYPVAVSIHITVEVDESDLLSNNMKICDILSNKCQHSSVSLKPPLASHAIPALDLILAFLPYAFP